MNPDMNKILEEFPERLKHFRESTVLCERPLVTMTRAHMSEISGLTVTSINYLENGARLPSMKSLLLLADALNLSLDNLVGRTHPDT